MPVPVVVTALMVHQRVRILQQHVHRVLLPVEPRRVLPVQVVGTVLLVHLCVHHVQLVRTVLLVRRVVYIRQRVVLLVLLQLELRRVMPVLVYKKLQIQGIGQ
jgi:hypothetical protein